MICCGVIVRGGRGWHWQSSLLDPMDLQRALRGLQRCAALESSHDDMASLCMPSLSVLLFSLLASVEGREPTGGA